MLTLAGQALYLFAPLLVAAALSGVVLRYNLWASLTRPIDCGLRVRGHRLFGDHKTWRGVVCALLGCTVAVTIQAYIVGDRADGLAVVDYRNANVLLLGAALGGGATLGELPNSFVKRQVGIPPGARGRGRWAPVFYLWDQLDLLMPTWPFLLVWVRPDWPLVAMSVALVLILHQALSVIGYMAGARRSMR